MIQLLHRLKRLTLFCFHAVALVSFAHVDAARSEPRLGDRLVVAVNGIGYTQRQAELYIVLKESLRKTADGSVRVVDERNWRQALTVFAEDMLLLQESDRLGSLQGDPQLVAKYIASVRAKLVNGRALAATLARLGAPTEGDITVRRTVDMVLRIAAFRRSKDQQTEPTKGASAATEAARPKWLDELAARAVIRFYQGAEQWVAIYPTGGP